MEHHNCIPYLAKLKGTKNSQADAELRKVGCLDVNILSRTKDRIGRRSAVVKRVEHISTIVLVNI